MLVFSLSATYSSLMSLMCLNIASTLAKSLSSVFEVSVSKRTFLIPSRPLWNFTLGIDLVVCIILASSGVTFFRSSIAWSS